MDLFIQLKEAVGCEFISDMRREPYNSQARRTLKTILPEDCPVQVLLDIIFYIYGEKNCFETVEQAKEFLAGK